MANADNPATAPSRPRILLIDSLRGLALLAMASYHFTWDLGFFGYIDPQTATQGAWKVYARCIASSFLFLAGLSLVLAHVPVIRWQSLGKRLGMVAVAALVISLGTLFAMPDEWIHFGILHNIALSGLVCLAFLRLPPALTAASAVAIAVCGYVNGYLAPGIFSSEFFDPRYLNWTGFAATPPRSNDFVPLFPWLAAPLAGVAFGRLALDRGWLLRLAGMQVRPNILGFAGRHSLAFYLIHQPVLIGLVYLFSLVHPADIKANYSRICTSQMTSQGYEVELSKRYCGCVADQLAQKSLLQPLMDGTLAETDAGLQSTIQQCSAQTQ